VKEAGPRTVKAAGSGAARPNGTARLGGAFISLLAISFVAAMSVNISRLGSSLLMHDLLFSPEAVSSVAMISGLVAIPVTLAIGAYADRLGSRHFLFISYVLMLSGALILLNASALWQFWLAASLHLLAYSISAAMSQAMTSEIVPAPALSKSLSWMNTLSAAASIVTFAIGGVLFDVLAMPIVFLLAAGLALGAAAAIEINLQAKRPAVVPGECSEA
jgi:MFS family permease